MGGRNPRSFFVMSVRWDRTASFNHAAARAQYQGIVCRAPGLKIRIWCLGSNGRSLCPTIPAWAAVSEIQTKRVRAERGGSSLSLLKATTSLLQSDSFTTAETNRGRSSLLQLWLKCLFITKETKRTPDNDKSCFGNPFFAFKTPSYRAVYCNFTLCLNKPNFARF